MLPELISAGSFTIHTYGLLVALGILAGVILAEHLHRNAGGEPGRIVDMAFFVILAGLLGARIVYVILNSGYYADRPMEILMIWKGGLVFYGSLIGGMAALFAVVHFYRLPVFQIMDIGAAGMCLGHAFGRLGCFAAGCCYGRITDLPWAVRFTDPACLAVEVMNKPVHPVQLYSFAFLSGLTVFLVWLHKHRAFPGQVAAAYLIIYGIFRFAVEFLRGDPRGTAEIFGLTLSMSQWMSAGFLLIGTFMYFFLSHRDKDSGEERF